MTEQEFISERSQRLDNNLYCIQAGQSFEEIWTGLFVDMQIVSEHYEPLYGWQRRLTDTGEDFLRDGGFRTFIDGTNETWSAKFRSYESFRERVLGEPEESSHIAGVQDELAKERKKTSWLEFFVVALVVVVFILLCR